jgi:molybdopterin-containing oxidoreductase family iron-sulfur binding subunit
MAACPYHARYFSWQDPVWAKGAEKALSPFVSVRPRGVVEKCTFCSHRWQLAKDRAMAGRREPYALAEEEYVPACVEACPAETYYFGDLDNPTHLVHKLAKSPQAFCLLESMQARPQVYYLSRRAWVRNLRDRVLKSG